MNGESDMPLGRDNDEDEDDGLFDQVVGLADRLGLSGDKRSNYIDDHMTEAGYERVQTRDSYQKAREADEDEDAGGRSRWFGGGGKTRPQGGREQARNPRQRGDDPDRF
jgi:hypothetical protein